MPTVTIPDIHARLLAIQATLGDLMKSLADYFGFNDRSCRLTTNDILSDLIDKNLQTGAPGDLLALHADIQETLRALEASPGTVDARTIAFLTDVSDRLVSFVQEGAQDPNRWAESLTGIRDYVADKNLTNHRQVRKAVDDAVAAIVDIDIDDDHRPGKFKLLLADVEAAAQPKLDEAATVAIAAEEARKAAARAAEEAERVAALRATFLAAEHAPEITVAVPTVAPLATPLAAQPAAVPDAVLEKATAAMAAKTEGGASGDTTAPSAAQSVPPTRERPTGPSARNNPVNQGHGREQDRRDQARPGR